LAELAVANRIRDLGAGPTVMGPRELLHDEFKLIEYIVIARSEATKQSRTAAPHWIASLRSQ
jgi:hypothetical protein